MSEPITVLDPTGEMAPAQQERIARPATLQGLNVALLDITKPKGNVFLDRLQRGLEARGCKVERFHKPTFTRVAPLDLRREIRSRCDAVIEALAD